MTIFALSYVEFHSNRVDRSSNSVRENPALTVLWFVNIFLPVVTSCPAIPFCLCSQDGDCPAGEPS